MLLDTTARAAYDRVIHARKAAEVRNKQLDSKRQKFKSDLEDRERSADLHTARKQTYSTVAKSDEDVLKEEIERLRSEGSRLLEEEQRLMQQQLAEERMDRVNRKHIETNIYTDSLTTLFYSRLELSGASNQNQVVCIQVRSNQWWIFK